MTKTHACEQLDEEADLPYFQHITYGRDLFIFWSLRLCTSCFADDVTFSHNGPYGTDYTQVECKLKLTQ